MKDIKVGFCSRSLIIIIQVKETADCDGDYLQFGRDKFIITDRLSPKFCNKVILKKKIRKSHRDKITQVPAPIMREDKDGRVTGWVSTHTVVNTLFPLFDEKFRWDFRMVSKQSRTWVEEKDYEFDIWLNLKPSRCWSSQYYQDHNQNTTTQIFLLCFSQQNLSVW